MIALPTAHFTPIELLEPANPVTLNLIGAGGTGSRLIALLAELHFRMQAFGHPGLQVNLFDDDRVTAANLFRQRFSESELGRNKAEVLISRINRFYGTRWQAVSERFGLSQMADFPSCWKANIYVSCVDTPESRFQIAEVLLMLPCDHSRSKPYYWMDMGNSKDSGQCVLSTIGNIPQPQSRLTIPNGTLPWVTEEFKRQLKSNPDKDQPSCSLAEALRKQRLYINPAIATWAATLIEDLLTQHMLDKRGFYLNLADMVANPIPIPMPADQRPAAA